MPARKASNLSLDTALLSEAREMNINLSRAAENGIAEAIKSERERRWRLENADAIKEYNKRVEKEGLLLAKYRTF